MADSFGIVYNRFVEVAKGLNGFVVGQKEDVPYDITDLVNGYCKACDEHDEVKRNQYISALMVRYWHVAILMYKESKSTRLDFDDIVGWMYDAFEKAVSYRSWLDKTKAVGKDPKGAEKVINRCIYSIRKYWYTLFNFDKRKVNFLTYSLDALINEPGDDEPLTQLDMVSNPEDSRFIDDSAYIVQQYLDKGDFVKAIISDAILYQDSFNEKTTKEDVVNDEEMPDAIYHYDLTFSPLKVVRHLKKLDGEFIKYFYDKYDVNKDKLTTEVTKLSGRCNAILHKYINNTLEDIKNNKELLDLCM